MGGERFCCPAWHTLTGGGGCMPLPYVVNEMYVYPIFSVNSIGGKAIYSICKQLASFLKASGNWASLSSVAQLEPNREQI